MRQRTGSFWFGLRVSGFGWVLACAAHVAVAQAPTPPESQNAFGQGSHLNYVRDVSRAQTAVYERVIRAYDERLETEPRDAVAGVEKCLFIDPFADSEDTQVESAPADQEKCRADLKSVPLVNHPEAQLYLLDGMWGEEAIAAAEADLADSASWPAPLRSRLRTKLAFLYQKQDADKAGSNALAAVDLDATSDARLLAARWLARIGATGRAHALISATPEGAWEHLSVYDAADILVGLGDPTAAASLLRSHSHGPSVPSREVVLAKALARSGQIGNARELYTSALAGAQPHLSTNELREYFLFERDNGSRQQAIAAYERLRDRGYHADPFGYYRLNLSHRYPTAPWRLRDLLGMLALTAMLALLVVMPVLLIAPVHYRGLVRQVRGALPQAPTEPWRLRHAWYALAGLLLIGALPYYFCAYSSFEALLGPSLHTASGSDEHALGRALVWHTGLFAVLAIPLLRGVDFRGLLLGTWSWRRSILTGIACAILARIVLVLGNGLMRLLHKPAALASDLAQGLHGIHADHGTWAVLLVAVIASPILEEFILRGVVLTAFKRYVSFWPAALGQAIAFAALHEEMSYMPVFIGFGLLAALLCRRSQGLLAPISMHVSFNFFAVTALLATAHVIDGTV